MASIPLTEEQIADDFVVLDFGKVGLSDEQFVELCADNRDFHLELTAQKELVIMTPPGPGTGRRNIKIAADLEFWARANGTGLTFSPGTIFALANGSKRGPDASWVRREKWDAFTAEQQEGLPYFAPDFVVELMSQSDRMPVRFRVLHAKMTEYIENGVQLGWMIDPFKKKVYVYRPGKAVESHENPATISGDPVLPGFVFNIAEIWRQ